MPPNCSSVQLMPYDLRCEYMQNLSLCENKKYYFNYVKLLYCGFQPQNDVQQGFSIVAMLSICVLLFVILSKATDKFFCPTLKVISLRLGMSEHMAGVTLLAFGNGAPDILTSMAALNVENRYIYSDLLGSSLFVSVFVSGLICLISPFRMKDQNFIDVLFLIFSILCVDLFISTNNHVNIYESFCLLFIYIVYLVIMSVEQILLKKKYTTLEGMISLRRSMATVENRFTLSRIRSETVLDIRSTTTKSSVNVAMNRLKSFQYGTGKNDNLFNTFYDSLNPINMTTWKESGKLVRTIMICGAPIDFVLLTSIPLVDYEQNRHGWSKLLNCIQLVTMPIIFIFLIGADLKLFEVPLCVYTLIVTLPLAVTIFVLTRSDIPPSYHPLISAYSIIGSVSVIYCCCSEIINLFDLLGMVTGRSTSLLGCTLLAWGNSIGDLIANIALARQGYHKMGYAGCFGAPLFNLMFGLGIGFFNRSTHHEHNEGKIEVGPMGLYCAIFSIISLFGILIWIVTTDYNARQSLGVFCIIFYCLFILYALLGDFYIIETYVDLSVIQ